MFKKLFSFLSGDPDPRGHYLYVRCEKCGEHLKTRIDKANDLSVRYGERPGQDQYFCRKLLVGEGPCFQKIEVELTYDGNKNLVERKIQGGEFITRDAYQG